MNFRLDRETVMLYEDILLSRLQNGDKILKQDIIKEAIICLYEKEFPEQNTSVCRDKKKKSFEIDLIDFLENLFKSRDRD